MIDLFAKNKYWLYAVKPLISILNVWLSSECASWWYNNHSAIKLLIRINAYKDNFVSYRKQSIDFHHNQLIGFYMIRTLGLNSLKAIFLHN